MVRLIPNCANSIGGSPYSLANQHAAPLVWEENHSASRTLTTNQPSVTGASPEPASSSLASFTQQILAVQATAVSPAPESLRPRVHPNLRSRSARRHPRSDRDHEHAGIKLRELVADGGFQWQP